MRGPALVGAGVLIGAVGALRLIAALEGVLSAGPGMSERDAAAYLRRAAEVDGVPTRCEPAWLRQCDIVGGAEPW